MRNWSDEMREDFEHGWKKFYRAEKRREMLRRMVKRCMTIAATAFCVLLMAAIGGLVWISAFFSDYECRQIFKALAEVLWPR